MGNCFVSKPAKSKDAKYEESKEQASEIKRKEEKEETDSPTKALHLFKQKQKEKEDTLTEQAQNGLAHDKKVDANQQLEIRNRNESEVKQRNEKKNRKFMQAVIQEQTQIVENITKIEKNKTPADYQMILNALSQHYFFNNIEQQHKEDIVMQMFYCKALQGQFIFKQGDLASTYFIIAQGECEIIIHDEVKRVLKQGDAFGELALLYGTPRTASVKPKLDCEMWGIDRNTFRKAVEELVQKDYAENRAFIDNIKFFDQMNNDQKDSIAGVIVTQQFKKGDAIVYEGDVANSYFIIKSGTVSVQKNQKEIRKMTAGDSFGEQALYQNSVRGASVLAESDAVKCLALGRDTITKILGDKIQVILYNNLIRWSFEKNQSLNKLTKIQIEKIVARIENTEFKDGTIVYQKDTKCDKLAIVLEGSLKQGKQEIAAKGALIGEQYLIAKNREKLITENIIMSGDGRLGVLTFEKFFEAIGGDFEQAIEKNVNNHEVKYMVKSHKKENYDHLQLQDMMLIKKLGFGQFGSVYLVKNRQDQKYYALKCIAKTKIVEQNLEKHLTQEKKVLEAVQFPLIMKFIKTIKDNNNIYFLVEYIKGMELFDVIRDIGLLNTYDSQFYIGSLVVCIEYLHSMSIIYRDIKPENIMVDHQGYMKLIDMGTAKFLKGKNKTFTIIGTPHYMAPEIITGKGYTYSVDIWSIGVCLYEFMCGGVPFAEVNRIYNYYLIKDAEDPYEIYEEIIKKPLTYPSFVKDRKAKKIMDQMINKTPEIRLGGSYAALKANPWFDHFDWDKLLDKELKPPYVPPRDKMILDKEMQKSEQQNKNVVDEIKVEQGKVEYKKEKAKNPDWDKEF